MMFRHFFQRMLSSKRDWLVVGVLIIAAIANGFNITGFPSYREDEGTYMSQAWSVVHEQKLAPYTYWYDHAPGGWIFIALWNTLSGGFFYQSMVVDTGRIFMLVLQVVATYLVYAIARNITGKRSLATVAALVFSLTPLSIVLHRRVLIDNIMGLWFLFSVYFLTKEVRLKYVILSAFTFALAVLTKESAIAFFPVMVFVVWYVAHRDHRHFAVVIWIGITLLLISFYPLFALFKGELMPAGMWFGGDGEHVSLYDALVFHANRDSLFFLTEGSSFRVALEQSWLRYSFLFIMLATVATILHMVWRRNKWSLFISLLTCSYLLFIIGRQLLDWYIIPLLPLLSLSIALLVQECMYIMRQFVKHWSVNIVQYVVSSLVVILVLLELFTHSYLFTLQQTQNQKDAVVWAKEYFVNDEVVLIDNYAFVDLNPNFTDITKIPFHYYWKVDTDPQVRYDVLNNDWNNIRYLLFTPAIPLSINRDDLTMVRQAYERSYVVKRFNQNDILNEGYPVEVREVNNANGTLAKSWDWYKKQFIRPDGQVIDPSANNQTTSEGQSYALLRAVWEEDPETFASVLQWTFDHMKLSDAYLFAWLAYEHEVDQPTIVDLVSASDADEDIALALLFAAKHWQVPEYEELAKEIVKDIWKHEVVQVLGKYYFLAGKNVDYEGGYLINPSYTSPGTYRIFAKVDQEHPWERLAKDSYQMLDRLQRDFASLDGQIALPPNWFVVTEQGEYFVPTNLINREAELYGYDAFRLYWRIALDYEWHNSNEALEYLESVAPFFESEWQDKQTIAALYTLDGTPVAQYDDVSTNAGPLAIFSVTDPELAIQFFSKKFWSEFEKEGYWRDSNDYYDQNWGWFATALYAKNTPNLWDEGEVVVRR